MTTSNLLTKTFFAGLNPVDLLDQNFATRFESKERKLQDDITLLLNEAAKSTSTPSRLPHEVTFCACISDENFVVTVTAKIGEEEHDNETGHYSHNIEILDFLYIKHEETGIMFEGSDKFRTCEEIKAFERLCNTIEEKAIDYIIENRSDIVHGYDYED